MYQERRSKRLEEKQQRGVHSRQWARESDRRGEWKAGCETCKVSCRQGERETRSLAGKGNGKQFERQGRGENDRQGGWQEKGEASNLSDRQRARMEDNGNSRRGV
jgi:hypothetical protein